MLQGCGKRFLGFGYDPIDDLALDEIEFEYLSSSTKFKYKNSNAKTRASATIRIKKDSLIWFKLSNGVGIEGARGKITKDSLVVMDRINKKVYQYTFEKLSEEFNFEFNYELFQAILIGDLPLEVTRNDGVEKVSNNFVVTQEAGDLTVINKISFKTRRLENLFASTIKNDNTLEIKYNEFKPLKEKPFAYQAIMVLTYFQDGKKDEATIDIEHKRVRIEDKPLRFPFKVPERYERL